MPTFHGFDLRLFPTTSVANHCISGLLWFSLFFFLKLCWCSRRGRRIPKEGLDFEPRRNYSDPLVFLCVAEGYFHREKAKHATVVTPTFRPGVLPCTLPAERGSAGRNERNRVRRCTIPARCSHCDLGDRIFSAPYACSFAIKFLLPYRTRIPHAEVHSSQEYPKITPVARSTAHNCAFTGRKQRMKRTGRSVADKERTR